MMESVEAAVIGAGVVGLAAARALARQGREVVVLESEDAFGTGISARNSEIIHAGIYYAPGSLKARLCVEGRGLLYNYLAEKRIPHKRCGKLIVAVDEAQVKTLKSYRTRATVNGVGDMRWLEGGDLEREEPALSGVAALLSPSTGILDSHALMLALLGDAEAEGAMIAYKSPVTGGRVADGGIDLDVGGAGPMTLRCRRVVNCAGLGAQKVASSLTGVAPDSVPQRHLAKGSYFTLSGPCPFTRPIYPVAEAAGLGIHLTLDLGGQARFGPDVEWIDEIDYHVDEARAESFYGAIRRYWPGLPDGALMPGYAGIRPKVQAPGDFVIQGPGAHGVKGLVNLYGIESPGLTACLAIARHAVKLL